VKVASISDGNPATFAKTLKEFLENENYTILEKFFYAAAVPIQQAPTKLVGIEQPAGGGFTAITIHCVTILFEDNTPDENKG